MDNGWNSFMQRRPVRVALYAVCALSCGVYAVDGVRELLGPGESSRLLIEQVGQLAFTVMFAARAAVCAWVAVVFTRMAVKAARDDS